MTTDSSDIIPIAIITNIRHQTIQIIVNDIDDSVGSFFFDGDGIISLSAGETIEVEQDRLNLGQIETLFKKQFLHVIFIDRDIADVT